MILRRIAEHVREQNWTAIGIDLVIVVLGVFLGIQLGNWNASRADARLGKIYTERLLVDLRQNRQARQTLVAYYDSVEASAERTVALLAAQDSDRALVIHAYRATEFSSFGNVRATWDEIISSGHAGLLPPAAIESRLADYFSYDSATRILDGHQNSPYRRVVRGTIPHALQQSIREDCSDVRDDVGFSIGFQSDCDLNVDDALVAATARALRADETIVKELRNRFSEIAVAQTTLLGDIVYLDRAIAALEGRVHEENRVEDPQRTTP